MKNIIFITTLTTILTFFCMGCSDNFLTPTATGGNDYYSNSLPEKKNMMLLFAHEELSISASGERIVNRELCTQVQNMRHTNLLITFDGWTNADTTCYVSQLSIENENTVILMEGGEQYINLYHELKLENFNQGNIRFYIALWCDEVICNSTAKLVISNIKIYGY